MEAGSKEDFHQTRAFGKEERVCGQAPAPQTSLVGGEHALGVRWGDLQRIQLIRRGVFQFDGRDARAPMGDRGRELVEDIAHSVSPIRRNPIVRRIW